MTTAPKKTVDREAELAEREAELARREAALAAREAALPKAKFTIRDLHRAVLSDPTISDAALTEMATKAGAQGNRIWQTRDRICRPPAKADSFWNRLLPLGFELADRNAIVGHMQSTWAGAQFKPVTLKTQRALALGFIKLVKEAGHWQDKAA